MQVHDAAGLVTSTGELEVQGTEPAAVGLPAGFRVLLLTEGSYPFHFGGVSTWAHTLISTLPEVHFELMALSAEYASAERLLRAERGAVNTK